MILVLKMAVKAAMRQAGGGHQIGQACPIDSISAKFPRGGGDNVPPSLGRFAFRFPHCLDLFFQVLLDNSNSLIDI
jgi:hypothetical protein